MMKKESLEFLDSCIEFLNNLSDLERAKLNQIYKAEMEKACEKTDLEILMPEERFISEYEVRGYASNFLSVEKKKDLDYKTSVHKEITADGLECMAA